MGSKLSPILPSMLARVQLVADAVGHHGQAAGDGLAQHPAQRDVVERVVVIAAADVGMHAAKPDLAAAFQRASAGMPGGLRRAPVRDSRTSRAFDRPSL